MTTDAIIQAVLRRPFVPFEMYLADGRVLTVGHPDYASIGVQALTVRVYDDDGRVETVDNAPIVSLRTLAPVDPDD